MHRQTVNLELQSVDIVRKLVTLPECVIPKSRQIDTRVIIFKREQRVPVFTLVKKLICGMHCSSYPLQFLISVVLVCT